MGKELEKKRKNSSVDYMRAMATECQWKIKEEILYLFTDGTEFLLVPEVTYIGIPYTQGKNRRRFNLKQFQEILQRDGVFAGSVLLGNDCSAAVSLAWGSSYGRFPVMNTRKFFDDLCGPMNYVGTGSWYVCNEENLSTKEIIQNNDEANMMEGYRSLKPGDGLLQYDRTAKKGHIMMVSQCDDHKVAIIDQKGFGENWSGRDDTSWRVDYPYSFQDLRAEGFLPVYLSPRVGILTKIRKRLKGI